MFSHLNCQNFMRERKSGKTKVNLAHTSHKTFRFTTNTHTTIKAPANKRACRVRLLDYLAEWKYCGESSVHAKRRVI